MSEHARQVLDCVGSHPSKGSARYYRPCLGNYFFGLQSGISECVRTVGSGGLLCLVVQDSYYKDVHNDLPLIFVEMAESLGWSLSCRTNFPVSRSMARRNGGSRVKLPRIDEVGSPPSGLSREVAKDERIGRDEEFNEVPLVG